MKKTSFLFVFVIALLSILFGQEIPYNTSPDWESNPGKIGTGLGIADINGDGWKDIIVANGNDILRNHVEIYYNQGYGVFNTAPDWVSADVDYHGHLAVGDVNKDGWIDVAVSVYIGAAGFSEPGKIKVYYNNEGELEANPSFVSDGFYTFSCAFGDADGDGDLDLAAACGEEYYDNHEYSKIFINNNGVFDSLPAWETGNLMMAYDVDFADFDRNGFLDLALGTTQSPAYVFLSDENGIIPENHSWKTVEENMSVNSLDVGDVNNDGYIDLVFTNNNQVVNIDQIHLYTFSGEIPDSGLPAWTSESFQYASGVILYDVNRDENLDLIHGGWWKNIYIQPGNGIDFNDIAYTSTISPVTEAFQIADLGREEIEIKTDTIIVTKDNISLIYLSRQIIENILEIKQNGIIVEYINYCAVPNKNWISFSNHLSVNDTIIVQFEYSKYGDLVVSNWEENNGDYIFYNQDSSSVNVFIAQSNLFFSIYPNPASDVLNIKFGENYTGFFKLEIISIDGKIISNKEILNANYYQHNISGFPEGVYLIKITTDFFTETRKIIIK